MASAWYTAGRAGVAKSINLEESDISVMLIDLAEYPDMDLENDTDQTDIPDAANLSEVALTGKTIDGYIFRATDITFPSVEAGESGQADGVILFFDADTYENSTLIMWIEFDEPVTLDGFDVIVVWDPDDGISDV